MEYERRLDVKEHTIHIELTGKPEHIERITGAIGGFLEKDLPSFDVSIYFHSALCEESDHCAGPGSNLERRIAAKAWSEGFAAQGEASFDMKDELISDVTNPYSGKKVFG